MVDKYVVFAASGASPSCPATSVCQLVLIYLCTCEMGWAIISQQLCLGRNDCRLAVRKVLLPLSEKQFLQLNFLQFFLFHSFFLPLCPLSAIKRYNVSDVISFIEPTFSKVQCKAKISVQHSEVFQRSLSHDWLGCPDHMLSDHWIFSPFSGAQEAC